jgi:hypothetical protein
LFQISSNTKKPKRQRDDTVLGRLQSTVRKFVFQDGDSDARNSGGEALRQCSGVRFLLPCDT